MMRQYELVEKVAGYDPRVDEDLLNRAYVFSMRAHGAQTRASGDPYFSHPLEVAGILADYKLDGATIATALLHDTVEDTLATLPEIERQFGPEVAKLVDGVTKLSKLALRSAASREAENFRKLVLAMSDDIRVLLVKLADRLHNMRTLGHLDDALRRQRIAAETMEIYAPLAERIGMHRVKEELEDLAFTELEPAAHALMLKRLEFLRARAGDLMPRIAAGLKRTLAEAGIEAEVSGREKQPYSIWRKMQRRNVSFEQLSDILAFRLVVASQPQCYLALGAVHAAYRMVPERFKDYISVPKPNHYRSLHTTVIGPENQRIEVQIRTAEMHEVAEFGVAAHWCYTEGSERLDLGQFAWLKELRQLLEHASSPEEFLEHTKLEMYQDQVFCFTPKGQVIALPRGATSVDFAYALHTEIGDSCVGAKVNGRIVPLRAALHNGDQVEIMRSRSPSPNPSWESFVVTGRARSAIRRFVRARERAEYRRLGRAIAEKSFREHNQEFEELELATALPKFELRELDELYERLGEGRLTGRELSAVLFADDRRWGARDAIGAINRILPQRFRRAKASQHPVPIHGLVPGMAVHYAPCCHPLPGDRIVGIVLEGKGVMVHTIDCETLAEFAADDARWLDVKWEMAPDKPAAFVSRINVLVENAPGSLGYLSSAIAGARGNITNLKIIERNADFFEMHVDIEVADVKHLNGIVAAVRAAPQVHSAERLRD